MNFEEYILNAKSQLYCNASDEYKKEHITYGYTNEQIDENWFFFKQCYDMNLSEYKALLFFSDYLGQIFYNAKV